MWRGNEKVSRGAGMINAISVKDRLKKQAIEDGKTMQDKLVTLVIGILQRLRSWKVILAREN